MRLLVLVLLLLANAALFAWWQGNLSPLWPEPGASEREPERLARQLQPEAIQIVGARAPGAPPATSSVLPTPAVGASAAAPGASTAGTR